MVRVVVEQERVWVLPLVNEAARPPVASDYPAQIGDYFLPGNAPLCFLEAVHLLYPSIVAQGRSARPSLRPGMLLNPSRQ